MSSSEAGVVIRYATKEDVPTILSLIQELADYEKEPDAVLATHESLSKTIAFAPSSSSTTITSTSQAEPTEPITSHRPARCLMLITPDGLSAGMALYFYNYSTWRAKPGIYLEDLYVRQSLRGKGYGTLLLHELAKEVVRMDGGRLEWCVLKWNKPSIDFYESEKIGAVALSDWQTMRVDGEALVRLAGGR